MPKNHFIMVRVNPEEKERLEQLSQAEGCSTLTEFCRKRLFQSLSTEIKLNQILDLIKKGDINGKSKE